MQITSVWSELSSQSTVASSVISSLSRFLTCRINQTGKCIIESYSEFHHIISAFSFNICDKKYVNLWTRSKTFNQLTTNTWHHSGTCRKVSSLQCSWRSVMMMRIGRGVDNDRGNSIVEGLECSWEINWEMVLIKTREINQQQTLVQSITSRANWWFKTRNISGSLNKPQYDLGNNKKFIFSSFVRICSRKKCLESWIKWKNKEKRLFCCYLWFNHLIGVRQVHIIKV